MRRLRPGLVIGVTTVVPATLAAARLRRLPCLLYAAELRSPAGDVVTRVEERMATTVVACSTTAARQFHAARVVYPGIDDSEGPSREAARDALALPRDALVVATAGNLSHGRGQDVLIRAIADLDGDVLGLIAGAPHPRRRDLDYRAQLRRARRPARPRRARPPARPRPRRGEGLRRGGRGGEPDATRRRLRPRRNRGDRGPPTRRRFELRRGGGGRRRPRPARPARRLNRARLRSPSPPSGGAVCR